ncbi:hypothetical protein [Treponema pedis]
MLERFLDYFQLYFSQNSNLLTKKVEEDVTPPPPPIFSINYNISNE